MTGPCRAPLHGSLWAYDRYGCRCPGAVAANTAHVNRHTKVNGKGGHSRTSSYDELDVETALARLRAGDPAPRLGWRERRAVVARLTAWGWSAARIATALGLASRSVTRHRRRLREEAA